ncbi:MAG TPA: thioredoxin family protein [Bacteroidota bacterium]|jgi:peroxiredoxin|nr:thioredoxin family protein [Bacteroidota bacterium]
MKHLVALLLLCSVAAYAGEMKSVKIGEEAPAFALKNYDGKEFGLKQLLKENKYTVVMFISTECPVSNAYNERMVKLNETFGKKGIAFVGINANKAEDVKMIASHSKDHGFKFPVLKDEKNKIADLYGALVTPEAYVINPEGKVVYHGRIDDSQKIAKVTSNDLSDALEKLLAGKAPATAESKAFGCTIKRINS